MRPLTDWAPLIHRATTERAILFGLLSMGLACGSEPTPPPSATVVGVSVSSPATTMASAGTMQLQASVRGSDGTTLTDRRLAWTSSDPLLATVSQSGLVTAGAVRSGSPQGVIITASAEGVRGEVQLTVLPIPVANVTLSITTAQLRVGESLQLSAIASDASNQPLTGRSVIWSSSDATIAAVSAQGLLTAVAPGSVIIDARVGDVAARAAVTVPVVPALTFTVANAHSYPVRGDQVSFTWQSDGVTSCDATGSWSGARSLNGSVQVVLDSTGSRSWGMRCTGPGGEVQRSVALVVRLPVSSRSYDTFKDNGVAQSTLPVFYGVNAYGDFLGTGAVAFFSAELRYSVERETPETAPRAAFNWWTMQPDRTWRRATVAVTAEAQSCVHPRKVLVTEINGDRRPDLLVLCHGFDALPFAGEPNVALVSQQDGSYRQRLMSAEARFFHGGATCDLDDDGDVELITADGGQLRVYDVAVDGTMSYRASHSLSGTIGSFYSVECVDVDEDGQLDIVAGGHEPGVSYGNAPTRVWFGKGNNTYQVAIIPAVFGDGTVLDFTVTGTGPTRTVWVLRTSGGDGPSYIGNLLQRVDPKTMLSQIAFASRQVEQLAWVVPYIRGGVLYIGAETNGLLPSGGRGWEVRVTP